MQIINIEKLDGHKIVVLTGRIEHVRAIVRHFQSRLYLMPRIDDYFMDYPIVIKGLKEELFYENDRIFVTTQSKEFLDCLLESDMDFVLATVRQFEHVSSDIYNLRVLSKEEALECRNKFNMELRV